MNDDKYYIILPDNGMYSKDPYKEYGLCLNLMSGNMRPTNPEFMFTMTEIMDSNSDLLLFAVPVKER